MNVYCVQVFTYICKISLNSHHNSINDFSESDEEIKVKESNLPKTAQALNETD